MGITTSVGLLKFSLSCIYLLAWPVIALGYPVFASIRAVENNSKYQMRKLVIYWTLFSLFSLFEFVFVKIIEWIPFWSSVRLVVIFWLVMPRFEGAYLAYQGLVRPVLLVTLQAVIYSFYNLKDGLCKRETCVDGVENYIKEYGLEALEELIASENEIQKRIDFQRGTKIIEQEEENSAATSKQICYEQSNSSARVRNGAYATTNVKEMTPPEASAENRRCETAPLKKSQQEWTCDLCKVTSVSRSMFNAHLQGSKHKSKLETTLKASNLGAKDEGPSSPSASSKLKDGNVAEKLIIESGSELEKLIANKTGRGVCINPHRDVQVVESEDKNGPAASQQVQYANVEVEEITPPKASGTETPNLKQAQQEWTCDLCKVTTTNEITFNGHLQGSKHKSKLETTLKASNLGAKDEGSSPSATSKLKDGNVSEKLIKESGSELEKLIANKTGCGECINSHRDVQVVESEDKNGPAASQQVQYANVEVEEITPPKASGAETPILKEAMQEWTCDLCNVTTSEITIIGHLLWCKHNSKLETTLKASNFGEKDEGPSSLATSKLKDGNVAGKLIRESGSEPENLIANKTWRRDCINSHRDVQVVESEDSPAASQQVLYANVEVEEITPPKASGTETPTLKEAQQEWTCDVCKLTTISEITFNCHLQGRKHKSKLETTLKASNLGANDEGPSHSATSRLKDGNVAEKLIKESGSELENLIANKTGREECINSHRDVQVVESMDKNGPAASQQVPYANAEVKEITPPKASCSETPTLKEAQQEWTCDLCKVTTTSEITLNGHLHGCKHKSKLGTTLKASMLGAKDKGSSPSATSKLNDDNVAEKLIKESSEMEKLIASQTRHAECGSSHGDVQVVKSEENNGPAASQQVSQYPSTSAYLQVQYANAEAEEILPPKATSCAETPPLKKTQQEWRCDLCNVKTTSENNLNAHLWGSKHKSVFESLKTSKLRAKHTGLSRGYKVYQSNLVVTKIKDGAFKYWCNACGVKLLSYVDVASHLKGKQHSSNMNP